MVIAAAQNNASYRFAYDALDRLTRVGYPAGSVETTTYHKLDVASRTDRLWHPGARSE